MRKLLLVGLCLLPFASANAEVLYTEKGKSVDAESLSSSSRLRLYDLQIEYYEKIKAFIRGSVLESHVEELMKKSGKSKEEVEADLTKGSDPSDADAKKWFEENKSRMPPQYTFEQLKPDIVKLLSQEMRKEKLKALMDKLMQDKNIKVAVKKPKAPKMKFDTSKAYIKGDKNAKITVVEFADFQCPHCKEATKITKDLLDKYKKKFKLAYFDYPINRSGISRKVSEGGVCANEQGKYWDYHELAFKRQKTLTNNSPVEMAKELKLDVKKFEGCLKNKKTLEYVEWAKSEGDRVGVSGTPTFFIDGVKIHMHSKESLEDALKEAISN